MGERAGPVRDRPPSQAREDRMGVARARPSRIRPANDRDASRNDGNHRAQNPQVRRRVRPSSQVVKPAPRTLSRWRHGFEPRWDYQGKTRRLSSRLHPGQKCRHGLPGDTKAQVRPTEQAGPPVSRPAFVPQTTPPRHGAGGSIEPSGRAREGSSSSHSLLADAITTGDSLGDDYLTKPFGIEELMACVRALLRRAERRAARGQHLPH